LGKSVVNVLLVCNLSLVNDAMNREGKTAGCIVVFMSFLCFRLAHIITLSSHSQRSALLSSVVLVQSFTPKQEGKEEV